MKILFFNDYSTEVGGAEIAIHDLKKEFQRRGYEAKLFSSSARQSNQKLYADYLCSGTLTSARTYLQVANFSAYYKLKKLLKEWQPDVIHVSMFLTQLSPLILPLLKGYPTIWHLHWYRGICPTGTKHLPSGKSCDYDYGKACVKEKCLPIHQLLPLMWQMKYLEKHKGVFRKIVANSSFVKEVFERSGYKDIEVIWYGIKELTKGDFKDFDTNPTIVFAGRLVKEKGVDQLLKSFALICKEKTNVTLKIAGEGSEESNLKALSKSLNIDGQVQFLGNVTQEKMHKEFASAWVQVIPSIWNEPFGLTVIESMQRGTPVVAAKNGGISELIINESTGFLTQTDENEMAKTILKVLASENLRLKLRQHAHDFVQNHFQFKKYADKFLNMYKEVI